MICARSLNQVSRSTVSGLLTSKSGWLDQVDPSTFPSPWNIQVGDYWVIYLLSKNLNPIAMKELLEELKTVMVAPTKAYSLPDYPTLPHEGDQEPM